MNNLASWAVGIALVLGFPNTQASSRQPASTSFDLTVSATDATSVKLHWPPVDEATDYVVSRDGNIVGTTVGALGYFSDFDLRPGQSYSYSVTARTGGTPIAQSTTASAMTAISTMVRTHYTVLALAFNPDAEDLTKERVYLQHRIQFLRQASLGSAIIDLYKGGIVSNAVTPAVMPGTTAADYPNLVTRRDLPGLDGNSIVDLIERGDIDHVWVVKSPIDFAENALIGNRMIQGNGQVGVNTWMPIPVASSRSFFVNAYLPDERSWDAYVHMFEGIMTSISDGYPDRWPRDAAYMVYTLDRSSYALVPAMLNLWETFRLTDGWNGASPVQYASPGHSNIGSSHFPPTTPRECANYCYYDPPTWQRYVDSNADYWLDYPIPDTVIRKLNGYDFGAFNHYAEGDASYAAALIESPELHPSFKFTPESYHQWWFAHMPNRHRRNTFGDISDWWLYIYDFNRFDGAPTDYGVGGFPAIPQDFPPIDGEYGTNEPSADNWGLDSHSGAAKAGTLASVVGAAPVRHVTNGGDTIFEGAFELNHVLEVTVENAQDWDFLGFGRNDVFYPMSRRASWHLQGLAGIEVSIRLGTNAGLVVDTNPVIRLYGDNPGTRIEFVPRENGAYANLFLDTAMRDSDGWYNFYIPIAGDATWEKNVIGYVDPSLSPEEQQAARAQLEKSIFSIVRSVEISIRTTTSNATGSDDTVSYSIDGLRLLVQ